MAAVKYRFRKLHYGNIVSKYATQKSCMERFSLEKIIGVEVKEIYQVKISKKFVLLENTGSAVDVNRALEALTKKIRISGKEILSYYEPKQRKSWFDEGCSKEPYYSGHRIQAEQMDVIRIM
jgi:hypothetical protein